LFAGELQLALSLAVAGLETAGQVSYYHSPSGQLPEVAPEPTICDSNLVFFSVYPIFFFATNIFSYFSDSFCIPHSIAFTVCTVYFAVRYTKKFPKPIHHRYLPHPIPKHI
jgi:hypothetical protein